MRVRVRVGGGGEDKDTDTPQGMELQGELATDLGIEGLERLLPQAVVRRDVAEQGGRKPAVGLAVLWREAHSGRCAIGHVVNGWQALPKESDERRRARATGAAHLVHRRPLVALLDVAVLSARGRVRSGEVRWHVGEVMWHVGEVR